MEYSQSSRRWIIALAFHLSAVDALAIRVALLRLAWEDSILFALICSYLLGLDHYRSIH